MLTQRDIAPYLLRRNLIDPASIVQGDLTVLDASRRNRNFKVLSFRGPSYLLKQGISPDRVTTIGREAATYQFMHGGRQTQTVGLTDYIPQFYSYDLQERVLILELVREAEDFRQHHARRGRFSTTLAATMGKALATLHNVPLLGDRSQEGLLFADQIPWVLYIHDPPLGMLRDVSEANLTLIRIVQQSVEFCQALDELRRGWHGDRLIHHDIKWDNWLILPRSSSQPRQRMKLVDWELTALGDPCWDVGSVFSGYLSFWVWSIPITGGDAPERFLELSRYPLEFMKPALRSFWASYVLHMGLNTLVAEKWLLRSVRYGAARLVQTAFEHMQRSNQLTGNIVSILQLSLNILVRPDEAALLLLGIR
jgi:hypothetical protein